jgi:large subunit ribosomal protein L14e
MFNVGRVCVKIAGRDAGKTCIVVKKVDDVFVMIDGETRRRKCNTRHLEPLDQVLKLNDDASRDEVKVVFKEKLNIELRDTKPKKATERIKKQHKKKVKPVKEKKEDKAVKKKVVKKATIKKAESPIVSEKPVESIETVADKETKQ